MDYWHPDLDHDELRERNRRARKQAKQNLLKRIALYPFDNWIAIVALIVSIISLVRCNC